MAQVDDNGRRSAGAVTVKAHKRKPKGAPPTAKPKVPVKPYTRAAPSVMGRTQAAAKVEERAPGQRKRIRQTYVQQPLAERQKQAAAAQKQKGGVADVIRTTHDERERAHAVTQAFVKWAKAKPEDRGKPTADIVKGARVVKNRTEKIDLKNAMKAFGQAPGKLDKVQGPKNTGLLATVDAVLAGVKTAGAVKKAGDFVGEHFMKGSAFARVSDVSGSKVVKNAGRELVDIPANAVPSLYVPAKELATGHPGKAAKTLAQPFVELAKHPLKSLEDHPVSSALMLSGVEGAIGRGAGAALRRAPSEALREVGSTKGRAPATVPGTTLREDRPFSKNVIHKAFQVRAEKGRTEPPIMSTKQIQRRADEHAAASEDIRRINRDRTVKESTQAIGGKKANAETSLVAQRITNGSEADLRAYLDELKKAEPNLEGSRLAANQEAQRAIEGALKKRDPEVQAHGEAYAKINVALQTLLAKHGVLSETAMETARRLPAAARDGVRQKDGELFDALGDPLPAEALAPKGGHEPAFVTHAPGQRGARNFFVRTDQAPRVAGAERTGEAVAKGTLDLSPEALVEQNVKTRGLVDAADRFGAFVKEFGARGDRTGNVRTFPSYQRAADVAREINHAADGSPSGAVAMTPVRLNPFGGRADQLRATLEHANEHDGNLHVTEAIDDALAGKDGEGPWALVPADAAARMREQIGGGRTTGGKIGAVYGSAFRRNVLATSPKWLTGNVVEAAVRAVVAQAGPMSYMVGKRALGRHEEHHRYDSALEARMRTTGGGHYSLQLRNNIHSNAEQFAGTRLAGVATALGRFWRSPGPKQVADVWHAYTDVVMNAINGRLEHGVQTAMLGKALREHPLMSDHLYKLSQQAIDQAAQGIHDVNTMAQLGREVDRMYGRYGKFSPTMRRMIAGYTPFIAWSLNAVRFVYDVLPRDHPVLTALLASTSVASEDWRRQHGLVSSFLERYDSELPAFLQGSIPTGGDAHLRASHYVPFGIFDTEGGVGGALAGSLLPQAQGILSNLKGEDWTGRSLTKQGTPAPTDARSLVAAAVTMIEGTIPITSQAATVGGVKLPNDSDSTKIKGDALSRLNKLVNPAALTTSAGKSQAGQPVSRPRGKSSSGGPGALPGLPPLPALPPLPPLR